LLWLLWCAVFGGVRVTAHAMAGDVDVDEQTTAAEKEKAERAAAAKSAFDRIQAERAALPMFPYREQILQAGTYTHPLIISVSAYHLPPRFLFRKCTFKHADTQTHNRTCVHTHTHTHTHTTHTHRHTHTHTQITRTGRRAHTRTRTNTHTQTHTHTYVRAHMHRSHAHTHTHTPIHTRIYTHTHTHTHIHSHACAHLINIMCWTHICCTHCYYQSPCNFFHLINAPSHTLHKPRSTCSGVYFTFCCSIFIWYMVLLLT
jgi:hypothetical protein